MSRQLLKGQQVAEIVQRSKRWIFEAIRAGMFPRPVIEGKDGAGHLWDKSDVDRWVEERIAKPNEPVRPYRKENARQRAEASITA